MAQKTLFFAQPYDLRRQKLVAGGAQTFLHEHEALRVGATLARRRAGVVVLSQSYDAERQKLNRPVVLRIHGRVPADWIGGGEAAPAQRAA